jgi:hypothetical protein
MPEVSNSQEDDILDGILVESPTYLSSMKCLDTMLNMRLWHAGSTRGVVALRH